MKKHMRGVAIVLLVLTALLFPTACNQVQQKTVVLPATVQSVRVIDATGPANISAMKSNHVTGYIGYIAGGGSWKWMSKASYLTYKKNGIAVGFCYEASAGWMNGGRAAGVSAMKAALAVMRSYGANPNTPVYFACDFDAPAKSSAISACLDGGASVHPLGRKGVGLYAGYGPISYNLRPKSFKTPSPAKVESDGAVFELVKKHAAYLWQTYAWSGHKWFAGANLWQHNEWGKPWGNLGCDYDANQVLTGDWGQEGGAKPTPPIPTPVPTPVPVVKTMTVNVKQMKVYNQTMRSYRFSVWRNGKVRVTGANKRGIVSIEYRGKTGWTHYSDMK